MSSTNHPDMREGETALPYDPAETADGPNVFYIGRIRTPWKTRRECPRNIFVARGMMKEAGRSARLEFLPEMRPGLQALEGFSHIVVIYWMHRAARSIIVQRPNVFPGPRGVFSLRSPVRPNPLGLCTARILSLDPGKGVVEIDAIDCMDGTPLVDIKPWIESIDAPDGDCRVGREVGRRLTPPEGR